MKILIVDDNQDLASILQMILEDEGHEIKLAEDGEDGYLAYLLFQPDLVITDIQMPRKNGFELIENIRAHNPMVRTIYISGDMSEYWSPLEEEKKRYHANFLEKPFSKDELIRLLSESFG